MHSACQSYCVRGLYKPFGLLRVTCVKAVRV